MRCGRRAFFHVSPGDLVPLAGPEWAKMKAEVRSAALQDKTRYGEIGRWYFEDSAP